MHPRVADVPCSKLLGAFGCGVLAVSCASSKGSGVWLGAQGFAEMYGGEGGYSDARGDGGAVYTGSELPKLAGRAVDAELRFDALPFELMIGQEWSRNGPSTDSHIVGVRWYMPSELEPRGPFIEGVAKFANDDNGGSSAVDGIEVRMGVAAVLSKRLILDLVARMSYFDSSDQIDEPRHVTEGGLAVGLRFGL